MQTIPIYVWGSHAACYTSPPTPGSAESDSWKCSWGGYIFKTSSAAACPSYSSPPFPAKPRCQLIHHCFIHFVPDHGHWYIDKASLMQRPADATCRPILFSLRCKRWFLIGNTPDETGAGRQQLGAESWWKHVIVALNRGLSSMPSARWHIFPGPTSQVLGAWVKRRV